MHYTPFSRRPVGPVRVSADGLRPGPGAEARHAVVRRPGLFRVRGHGQRRRHPAAHRVARPGRRRAEEPGGLRRQGRGGRAQPARARAAGPGLQGPAVRPGLARLAGRPPVDAEGRAGDGGRCARHHRPHRLGAARDGRLARRQGHDRAHARHPADRPRPAAVHPRGGREPAVRRRRPAREGRQRAARHPDQPRQGCAHHRAVGARAGPAHGARGLHRRGAGVEGVLPPDAGGRSRGGALGAAGLGHGREPERPGLEGRRPDAGLRPSRRLPAGALRGLLREAARGADRGRGPADARCRSRRRRRAGPHEGGTATAAAGAGAGALSPATGARCGCRDDGAAAGRLPPPPTSSRRPMRRPRSCSAFRAA